MHLELLDFDQDSNQIGVVSTVRSSSFHGGRLIPYNQSGRMLQNSGNLVSQYQHRIPRKKINIILTDVPAD